MRRFIAQRYIDSVLDSDHTSVESAKSQLPSWVSRLVERDTQLSDYWEQSSQLLYFLRSDAEAYCEDVTAMQAVDDSPHEHAAQASIPSTVENEEDAQVVANFAAGVSPNIVAGNSAAKRRNTVAWAMTAATLLIAGTIVWQFALRQAPTAVVADSDSQEDIDLRPLLATASAGKVVLGRLGNGANQTLAKIGNQAEILNLDEQFAQVSLASLSLGDSNIDFRKSISQAFGALSQLELPPNP